MTKRAPGFAASTKAQDARAFGMAMGEAIRNERRRNARHFAALWAVMAVMAVVFALAVLS